MSDKPKAKDMLALPPEKFWNDAVSRAITPKPLPHSWTVNRQISNAFTCAECSQTFAFDDEEYRWYVRHTVTFRDIVKCLNETELGCTIPPPLTQSHEALVREWRDKLGKKGEHDIHFAAEHIIDESKDGHLYPYDYAGIWKWLFLGATPAEQMACLLVAADFWEVK